MKKIILTILLMFLILPNSAGAVIQSLNSQSGQNQTFVNDTNVGISSASNVHTINWSGVLDTLRGGLGTSTWSVGAIPFFSPTSGIFSGDRLFIDTISPVPPNLMISDLDVSMRSGTRIIWHSVNPVPGIVNEFTEFASITTSASSTIDFYNADTRPAITLDFSSVTWPDTKVFAFPNFSGTFSLVESDQTFTGLNKFESTSTNSTIYVGSSTKSGCIALGDSDNGGITYITANDGVLASTSTKPSICQ